jgi:hypothetical protein
MTEYIISTIFYGTDWISSPECRWMKNNYVFDFKIDLKGNVYVKEGIAHCDEPQPVPKNEWFSVIDNIQIPEYIIYFFNDMIQDLNKRGENRVARDQGGCDVNDLRMFLNIVRKLKKAIKDTTVR